jgi:hypothetical protein
LGVYVASHSATENITGRTIRLPDNLNLSYSQYFWAMSRQKYGVRVCVGAAWLFGMLSNFTLSFLQVYFILYTFLLRLIFVLSTSFHYLSNFV